MTINEMLLQAFAAHLRGDQIDWKEEISDEQWLAFFKLAGKHSLLPLVYETVCQCESFKKVNPAILMQIKNTSIRQTILQVRRTEELKLLYQKLMEDGVCPLIVKGVVCRSLYPIPDDRISNDEDFLIRWEDFEKTDAAMRQWGMAYVEPDKEMEQEFEVSYYHPKGGLVVELHKDLFSESSDAYGNFNELFADVQARKIPMKIDEVTIYTLEYTDHLSYLIAHAFKHFLHSGFGIRQVGDIVLFAKKYEDVIDWSIVYEKCERMRALYFTKALFEIGKTYLGVWLLKPYEVKKWKRIQADPEALLADLLDGGVFGDNSMARKHSSTITLNAVASNKKGKEAKVSLRRSLFPSAKSISGRYPYLNRYPFLLPVAWMNRIWHYYKENKNSSNQNQAVESIQLGKQRVELLRKYKIID